MIAFRFTPYNVPSHKIKNKLCNSNNFPFLTQFISDGEYSQYLIEAPPAKKIIAFRFTPCNVPSHETRTEDLEERRGSRQHGLLVRLALRCVSNKCHHLIPRYRESLDHCLLPSVSLRDLQARAHVE